MKNSQNLCTKLLLKLYNGFEKKGCLHFKNQMSLTEWSHIRARIEWELHKKTSSGLACLDQRKKDLECKNQ